MKAITFIDAEVVPETGKIADFGAIRSSGESMHEASLEAIRKFLQKSNYLCGHNIIEHDMKYLNKHIGQFSCEGVIDTLHLSALLFPQKPYHALVKDEKLQTDELNNPLNDSKKARDLFYDEVETFRVLPVVCFVTKCLMQLKGLRDFLVTMLIEVLTEYHCRSKL